MKCITFSPKSGKLEGFLHNIPKGELPFDTLHADHLGPLEVTESGNKYILVIIDGFTRYVKFYSVKTVSSEEVVDCFKKYFEIYSRPRRLIVEHVFHQLYLKIS